MGLVTVISKIYFLIVSCNITIWKPNPIRNPRSKLFTSNLIIKYELYPPLLYMSIIIELINRIIHVMIVPESCRNKTFKESISGNRTQVWENLKVVVFISSKMSNQSLKINLWCLNKPFFSWWLLDKFLFSCVCIMHVMYENHSC